MKKKYTFFYGLLAAILLFSLTAGNFFATSAFAKGKRPTQVNMYSVKQLKNTQKVQLKWKKARGAKGYGIYQKKGTKTRFKKIKTVTTSKILSFITPSLTAGKTYHYQIRAYRKQGRTIIWGKYSKIKSIKIKKKTPQTNAKLVKAWNVGCAGNAKETYNGKTAKSNVQAKLYSNGHLIISGKGNTQYGDYDGRVLMPWSKEEYKNKIRKVTFGKQVAPKNISAWFCGCHNLTTAPVIPAGVTTMQSTFSNCTGLTTAPTIPASVAKLHYTFENCTSLTTAPVLPKRITKLIGTFASCTELTAAPVIPHKVIDMYGAFSGCTSLKTAPVIPHKVTDMYGTFARCTGLTAAPVLPASVTNLGYTFEGCTGLMTAPVLPEHVTYLSNTFAGCFNLTTAPVIPDDVKDMTSTFEDCTGLTAAPAIPKNVVYLGSTFKDCHSLTGNLKLFLHKTEESIYTDCLKDAATEEDCQLKIDYVDEDIARELLNTKGYNSKIVLGSSLL